MKCFAKKLDNEVGFVKVIVCISIRLKPDWTQTNYIGGLIFKGVLVSFVNDVYLILQSATC